MPRFGLGTWEMSGSSTITALRSAVEEVSTFLRPPPSGAASLAVGSWLERGLFWLTVCLPSDWLRAS